MPEHVVVRCYSCQAFQAQQLRKTNDFVCKMCGAKQSVRKIYARSFKAADIRPIVQEYNMKRGEIEEEEAQNTLKHVEDRALRDMDREVNNNTNDQPSATPRPNDWALFLEEDNDTSSTDTRQTEAGTELLTALPEFQRGSKSGHNSAQNANKWSAQPKQNNVVTGVKRKWTASKSRDSYESAPKYARHENTVSNEGPRLISTAQLARPTTSATPSMTRVTSETEQTQQHVIDKIRVVTANRAQNTSVTASVRHVSNTAPHAQSVSSVTGPAVTPSTASQKKKSEWDDFIDDEPTTDDTCQNQDGGELVFAADEGLETVTDEW